jgi:hypothetical protein
MREPRAPGHAPRDWSEAFAALPPETPPADALSSVFARIPASTPARTGRPWWIAAAAVFALAAVVPFARHSRVASDSPTAVQRVNRSSTDLASGHPASLAVSPQPTTAVPSRKPTPVVPSPVRTDVASDQKTLDARLRGHDEQKQIAKADTPHRKPHRTRKAVPTTDPPDSAMEPLYAESARLEALLALARDDRVASATAVALGSDFEARIAGIDAALVQPSLTKQRRLELWKDRVSALRAYASFESTQRALAASGERYDAMLVSID